MTSGRPDGRPDCWTDIAAALVLIGLTALTLSYTSNQLTYDEAVYLSMARQINRSGLPLRRAPSDLAQFYLFETSPPLIMYAAAATQHWFPGREVPSRIGHIMLFTVPTYLGIWWATRQRFGRWAGLTALLALLGNNSYMAVTHRVLLDLPLGLFGVIVLLAFERACLEERTRLQWSVVAGLFLVLSTWTKLQAICIVGSIVLYCVYLGVVHGRDAIRLFRLPLSIVAVCGSIAVIVLIAYFGAFAGGSELTRTLSENTARMSTADMGPLAILRDVFWTGARGVSTAGAVLLVAGCIAVFACRKHVGALVILSSYVLVTFGFNLWLFRMPGSGGHYLHSIVPSLAILTGAAGGLAEEVFRGGLQGRVLTLFAAAVQFASSPAPMHMPPYQNDERAAAMYVASHGGSDSEVLATTEAIQFYNGNPVGTFIYTPHDVLLQSLAGSGPNKIQFVVVPRGESIAAIETIQTQWNELLQRHFLEADAHVPSLVVYQRRSPDQVPE